MRPGQVWAANGSNEVLQQILQAFGGAGRTALGFTPSYSMHPIISAGTGTAWVDGHRRADFTIDADAAAAQVRERAAGRRLRDQPEQPDRHGGRAGDDRRRSTTRPTACVVVDEAYAEFARAGTPSALTLLPGRPRLIVSRTMSKAFGMAGLRLGYLAADPAVVDALQLVRLPYHLSSLTQAAARTALAHTDALLATVDAVKAQRDRIVAALPGMGLTSVAERRQLRAVRALRRRARGLAGAARPRRAGPRRRAARLAAGHRRHGGGDRRLPHRAG